MWVREGWRGAKRGDGIMRDLGRGNYGLHILHAKPTRLGIGGEGRRLNNVVIVGQNAEASLARLWAAKGVGKSPKRRM